MSCEINTLVTSTRKQFGLLWLTSRSRSLHDSYEYIRSAIKNIADFYNLRLITTFTKARLRLLSWARWIDSACGDDEEIIILVYSVTTFACHTVISWTCGWTTWTERVARTLPKYPTDVNALNGGIITPAYDVVRPINYIIIRHIIISILIISISIIIIKVYITLKILKIRTF
jgi:hypothetical protein